jgi:hypothetical protein
MSKTLCERLKEAVSVALNLKRTQGMIAQIKLGRLSSGGNRLSWRRSSRRDYQSSGNDLS